MKRCVFMTMSLIWILSCTFVYGQSRYYESVTEEFRAGTGRPLEVILDVDAGEIWVEKSFDRRTGSITMKFTRGEFREKIDFDESKNRLRVMLDKKKWHNLKKSDRDRENNWAEVIVKLPDGVDILFDSRIKAGEVTMAMGGLRLREFCLNNWAGEVEVRFDEPNPITMDFLDINVKVGEARFVNLGNARFEKADINGGIGEIEVDFSGDILKESMAKVDLDIGEATIILPTDMGIKLSIGGGFSWLSQKNIDRSFHKRGGSYYSDDYEDMDERFYVRVTPGLGELTIDRY